MAASVFLSEDKAATATRRQKGERELEERREGRRESKYVGEWHDDAECAIKHFYGRQGQGRRIVIECNNYFTLLSLEPCCLHRMHLYSQRLCLNGAHIF